MGVTQVVSRKGPVATQADPVVEPLRNCRRRLLDHDVTGAGVPTPGPSRTRSGITGRPVTKKVVGLLLKKKKTEYSEY